MNKFLMKDNKYIENFLSAKYGLVNNYNIRKLSIDNDLYQSNTFSFVEAMQMFGSIHCNKANETGTSSLLEFSEYFLSSTNITDLKKYWEIQFPSAPLYLQGIIYLDSTSITFDNNYFSSIGVSGYDTAVVVEAIGVAIVYSKGRMKFGNFTIQN